MSFSTIASQVVFQSIGGLLIGTAADHMFEPTIMIFDGNFIKSSAEVGIQLGLNAAFTSAWYEFMFKRGVRGEDPTKGFPFFICLIASQSNLLNRISALSKYFGTAVSKVAYAQSMPVQSQSVSAPGYINQEVPEGSQMSLPKGADEEAPPVWAN